MNFATDTQNNGIKQQVKHGSHLIKAMANQHRLLILCYIKQREYSVSELEQLTNLSQSTLSQHLARLRKDGLVETRRSAQIIYYHLPNNQTKKLVDYMLEVLLEGSTSIPRNINKVFLEPHTIMPALF
jgi:DNA-binding transcriptional ArsR family regulator